MEPQQADDAVDARALKPDDGGDSQQSPDSEFDAEQFASLLQNQLIAYNFSWDPLMKALEALAASMTRQQRAQKGNNNAMDDMREQLHAMRERLDSADQEKRELVDTVSQLQDQVGVLSSELQAAKQEQDAQRNELRKIQEAGTSTSTADDASPSYASTHELQNVKKALSNQLRRSLSAVFGEQFVVNDGDEDAEHEEQDVTTVQATNEATGESVEGNEDSSVSAADEPAPSPSLSRPPSRPGTGVSGVLRTPLPGVPFASEAMVKAELDNLRELQAALEAKLATHKDAIDSMDERLGAVDARVDVATALQQRRASTPSAVTGPSTEALQKQIDVLRNQQNTLVQQLKDQAQAADKQASGFKELVATLDDMAVQQKMYSARSDTGGKASGSDTTGPPQLDLSLVFSKIADLRRATDATIDQIQQSVRETADSTSTQQSQLDALRHAAVFNELQKLRLMEARLVLQKELLDRNQTHQDRTKPLLAEWKKQLEQTEDKLARGLCEQDIMDELQQLQRNYHRTMLTMTPLMNAPLMVAESLQQLADEVKDVQNGLQSAVLASILGGPDGDTQHARVDDVATKLRYLDEEVEATQQVNVVTEKKNDPLLKSLDTMRDKLESMWSLWHQNLLKKKGSGASSETVTPRSDAPALPSSEAVRDLELRLMGAARRITSLEEDVDRLGTLMNANGAPQAQGTGTKTSSDDVAKLRKEMQEEIQRLSAALTGLQNSAASFVPTAPPGRMPNAPSPLRGDLVGDLHAQMVKRGGGKDVDGRFHEEGEDGASGANGQRTTYDALLKDLTKKVSQAVLDKTGGLRSATGPAGINANPNVNVRALLENFTQKFDDRLEDTREFTLEELAKLRKELLDLLKAKLESALRDLRAEFMMIYYPTNAAGETNGDSTAVGTKPVMCVACSRPVPVSGMIREPGAYPSAEMIADQTNALLQAELEYDRTDDDFVFRAGFKMPADRKTTMTLPFLANNIRNRIALNKIDRKPRRPARHQAQGNPVDHIVKEAMDLDRKQRQLLGQPPSPPK